MSNHKQLDGNNEEPILEFKIKQGPKRSFLVMEPNEEASKLRVRRNKNQYSIIGLIASIAAAIRLYNLSYPDSVVFDEVHFGGFAAKYINGTFFMDVHPPLVKILFAAIWKISGYTEFFGFENIGDKYPPHVPYVSMRLFSAVTSIFTAVLIYLTLKLTRVRSSVAFSTSFFFIIENSFVTISRYILLDSTLIFFIAIAVYSFKRFEVSPSGSLQSYKYLLATGIALGFTVSSKWVGLFTFAWIGVLCLWRIWVKVGDLSFPFRIIIRESIVIFISLLVIPICLYLAIFQVHFSSLTNYSDSAVGFSSQFRTSLQGNKVPSNILADVGIGSTVSIVHSGTTGGYLHSHDHNYETGSKYQQVTLYPHLDHNNDWFIELYNESNYMPKSFTNLEHGTKIRLMHSITGRRLHSHDHKPPVSGSSDWQKEVASYGYFGFEGDQNDDWIIEIDEDESTPGEAQKVVKAIETKFRLRHAMTGCLLFSHEVKLPSWGFEQQEVTCASQAKPHLTLWYIESNENPLLPDDSERVSYKKPSFKDKFLETQMRMWNANKNLKEPHIYQSQPISWPFLLRGIAYWSKDNRQVYFFGNPVIWWSVSIFAIIFPFLSAWKLIAWQLGKPIFQDKNVLNFYIQTTHYLLGFAFHYLPSFFMSRQLFLHHYLPAYYFGILALGHGLNIFVTYVLKNNRIAKYTLLTIYLAGGTFFFKTYLPLTYGSKWTKDLCEKTQLLTGWDYNCNDFPLNLSEYKKID